ncbi:hypothetical protein HYU23_03080 [Candidatus Woesearchaeota archaeon]|nr:hypothetical protein [Candidatus Woesearchaeota archaeon]
MRKIAIALSLFIVIIFLLGILLGFYLMPRKTVEVDKTDKIITSSAFRELSIVGVDNSGKGVYAKIIVDVKPGTGLVLVNINDLLADYLTQLSARTAAKVASNFTNLNLSSIDIIYNIKANAVIIEGPSAGAAMTLATIAALQNRTINNSIFITGTIEENGTIGLVSGIGEKAKAAKENNATLFLIPEARYLVGYDKVKKCNDLNGINYCQINYLPKKFELSELLKLEIKQVRTIKEAADYIII